MLLLEHNRCCIDVAPDEGYEGDEVGMISSHEGLFLWGSVLRRDAENVR